MFKTSALVLTAFRMRPRRAGSPPARVTPLKTAVRQVVSRRLPSRRPLICTWVPDGRTGRPSCVWTLERSADDERGAEPLSAPPWRPANDAACRALSAA